MARDSLPPITGAPKMSDLKARILQPALTSNYSVFIEPPAGADGKGQAVNFIRQQIGTPIDANLLELTCSEASLPGSSLATIDINNDYMGITQKHAYRRLYDDRADFTFYVTQNSNYYQIRLFDAWMRYVVDEQLNNGQRALRNKYIYNRVQYPTDYQGTIKIIKYEKDYSSGQSGTHPVLYYIFKDAFPVSMNSIPVSYDSSSLLKVTVSFAYTRYYITDTSVAVDQVAQQRNSNAPGNPELPPNSSISNNRITSDRIADYLRTPTFNVAEQVRGEFGFNTNGLAGALGSEVGRIE